MWCDGQRDADARLSRTTVATKARSPTPRSTLDAVLAIEVSSLVLPAPSTSPVTKSRPLDVPYPHFVTPA
jgi:hypothetical protein